MATFIRGAGDWTACGRLQGRSWSQERAKGGLGSWPLRRVPAGFTILEMMIAAAIAMVIFTVGFFLFNTMRGASGEARNREDAVRSAALVFRMIEKDLATAAPSNYSSFIETKEEMVEILRNPPYTDYQPANPTTHIAYRGHLLQLTTSNTDFSYEQIQRFRAAYEAQTGNALDFQNGILYSHVRYYLILDPRYADGKTVVLEDTGSLYREVSLVQPDLETPANTLPIFSTDSDKPPYDFSHALLPNVSNFQIQYCRWLEETKEFDQKYYDDMVASDNTNPGANLATHLAVQVAFLDPNPRLPLPQRKRIFEKRIPLPAGFP